MGQKIAEKCVYLNNTLKHNVVEVDRLTVVVLGVWSAVLCSEVPAKCAVGSSANCAYSILCEVCSAKLQMGNGKLILDCTVHYVVQFG